MLGHPLTEMLGLIDDFKMSVGQLVEGNPDDANGLMQMIHKKHQELWSNIRNEAPDFRPYGESHPKHLPSYQFLQAEGDSNSDVVPGKESIYIRTVTESIKK